MPETARRTDSLSELIARGGARLLRAPGLMRTPIPLYRAGWGFLFGSRMLMLDHWGRRSGLLRHVVLEVFGHPRPDTYLVPSGFGERSQWFRNVLAHPEVAVSVGWRLHVPARARRLAPDEADAALAHYVARHPRAWDRFKPVVETTLGQEITERETALPIIELTLRHNTSR